MNPVWSAEQRRCLEALGFALYRVAAADQTHAPTPAAIDPLLSALLRAAGRDPTRGDSARIDANAWVREMQIPSFSALRADPAAKRALWPRLRAARRDRSAS